MADDLADNIKHDIPAQPEYKKKIYFVMKAFNLV